MIKKYRKNNGEKLSDNFVSNEFDCKGSGCCKETFIDEKLVGYLQKLRDHFGKPVKITSGYRCDTHNKKVGSTSSSQHKKGKAADITVTGVPTIEVAQFLQSIGVKGIIRYVTKNFVHLDTREKQYFAEVTNGKTVTVSGFGKNVCPYEKPKVTVKKGSRGDSVRYVQFMLIRHGFKSVGSIDGIAGVKTVDAIKAFQKKKGLTVDGLAGPKTIEALSQI